MNKREAYPTSPGPFVRSAVTTGSVMYDVILALLPAAFFGIHRFGSKAALVILASVLTAVLAEYAFTCFTGKDSTVGDGSAAVTGLLLALTLPAEVPLYIPFAGAIVAVALVKGAFGGLGRNLLNPALGARCLLAIAFRKTLAAGWTQALASGAGAARFLVGASGGMIGCSAAAVLVGGLYLLAAGHVRWQTPAALLASFAVFFLLFGGKATGAAQFASLLSGGVMLAAFFLAADPVTSPVSGNGKLVFGCLAGLLCVLFRNFSDPMNAVCCAVLLADLATPLIDRLVIPGAGKR